MTAAPGLLRKTAQQIRRLGARDRPRTSSSGDCRPGCPPPRSAPATARAARAAAPARSAHPRARRRQSRDRLAPDPPGWYQKTLSPFANRPRRQEPRGRKRRSAAKRLWANTSTGKQGNFSMPNRFSSTAASAALILAAAAPLAAQDPGNEARTPESPASPAETVPPSGTVFDGDWLTLGIGGVLTSTSYDGSDDYVVHPPSAGAREAGRCVDQSARRRESRSTSFPIARARTR